MDVHLAVRSQRAIHAVRARCDEEPCRHRIERIVLIVGAARERLLAVLHVPALKLVPVGCVIVHRSLSRAVGKDAAVEALQIVLDFLRQVASPVRRFRAVLDMTRVVHIAPALIRRLRIRNDIQRAAADDALGIINCIVAILRRDLIVR